MQYLRVAIGSTLLAAASLLTASCWYGVEDVVIAASDAGEPDASTPEDDSGSPALDAAVGDGCGVDEKCVILSAQAANEVILVDDPGEYCPADRQLTHCNIAACRCDPENNGHCETRLATGVADSGACGGYGGWMDGNNDAPCKTLLESKFAIAESRDVNGFKCVSKGSATLNHRQYCSRKPRRCDNVPNGICVPYKTSPSLLLATGHACPSGYAAELVREGPTASCGCACGKCERKGFWLYEDDACSLGQTWLEADGICRELSAPVRAYKGPIGGKCQTKPVFSPDPDVLLCVPHG